MATSNMTAVFQHLREAVRPRDGTGMTDDQLLQCFVTERDEAAFATLVHRHGAVVWGVCRRVLRDYHDAEDAFQATFLVLVRKAASIASRELLANWLYGVAYNTALKAKAMTDKRQAREKQVAELPEPEAPPRDLAHDLQLLLDRELSRLPDKYRVVIVLCDLDGKTRKEAARQLGWPEGTVSGRLTKARMMLAKRLARHSLAVWAGSLAAVFAPSASASVPPSVTSSTIQAASLLATGQAAAAGVVSARVAALTEGVVKAMTMTKLKALVVVLLVATLLGSGVVLSSRTLGQEPKPQPAEKADAKVKPAVAAAPAAPAVPAAPVDEKAKAEEDAKKEKEKLQGTWKVVTVEEKGQSKEEEDAQVIFSGDEWTMKKGDQVFFKGKFKPDPSKDPKAIDMEIAESHKPGFEGKTALGIYSLDKDNKDSLKLCLEKPGGTERPKEFTAAADSNRLLMTLKREKKEEK
jgi:RNA polymerase sigma-70 factor (ECF subfamily)